MRQRCERVARDELVDEGQGRRHASSEGLIARRSLQRVPALLPRRLPDPPLAAQYAILSQHYEAMLSHYGTPGVHIARKHIGWYSKGLPGSAEFRAAVNQTDAVPQVKALIRGFYEPLVEREAA